MNTLNCEYVRDIYPDVLHAKADANTVTAVRSHLAACAQCRAEAGVIEALFASHTRVPAGLHERIMRGASVTPRRRFAPRHLAVAATMAAALIGGSVLLNSQRGSVPGGASAKAESGLGVVTVEAAMVSGTGSLKDLTIEELEQLLGEIES